MNKKAAYILAALAGVIILLVGAGIGFVSLLSGYVSDQLNTALVEFREDANSAVADIGGIEAKKIGTFDVDFWDDTLALDTLSIIKNGTHITFTGIRFDGLELPVLYGLLSQDYTSEDAQIDAFLDYLALPLDMQLSVEAIHLRSEQARDPSTRYFPFVALMEKGMTMSFKMSLKNTSESFGNSMHILIDDLIEIDSRIAMTPVPAAAITALNDAHLNTLALGVWAVSAQYQENTTTVKDLGLVPYFLDTASDAEGLPKDDNYLAFRTKFLDSLNEALDAYQQGQAPLGSPKAVAALKQAIADFATGGKTLTVRLNDTSTPLSATSLDIYDISVN